MDDVGAAADADPRNAANRQRPAGRNCVAASPGVDRRWTAQEEEEVPEWRRRTPPPPGSSAGHGRDSSWTTRRPQQHCQQQQGGEQRRCWRQQQPSSLQQLHVQLPAFVPIKSWCSCREVAAEMEALPRQRLDQRLLSGAMQHIVKLHEAVPRDADCACFSRLLDLARPLLSSFDAFGLCILVRTAARLASRLSTEDLLAWCDAAERRLDSFNPQDLANSIFSVGVAGQRLAGRTLSAFCSTIQRLAGSMNAQEQANTLLGLAYMLPRATTALGRQRMQRVVEEAAVAVLRERRPPRSAFAHQELTNLAWAFSKLTSHTTWQRCEAQLWELFSEAADRAPQLPPQELSNLCLAMANTTFFHPQALSSLVAAAAACSHRLDEQHLDNILLSAATLPRWASAAGAATEARERQPCVSTEHVAALREELLRRLLRAGRPSGVRGRDPTACGICRSVWALAMLQACPAEVWHAAVAALQRLPEARTPEEELRYLQLRDAHVQLAAEGVHVELPPALGQRVGRVRERVAEVVVVSELQREVSAALRAAGVDHSMEFRPEGSYRPVDLALPAERIAIAVDGPYHFAVNRVHGRLWRLGTTEARDRLLSALGWRAVTVDFHAWKRLPCDGTAQQRWLQAQLAAVRQGYEQRCADGSGADTDVCSIEAQLAQL